MTQAPTPAASASSSRLSDYFHVQAPVATPVPEAGLPSLTSPKAVSDKANPDESAASSTRGDEGGNRLASGAMQMARCYRRTIPPMPPLTMRVASAKA
ncbi:hypothetical protein RIN66_22090 (plasmid) [Hafnia alvei]|uniref:hypothetical protein n=1 Tax=Hafnia alvei TaxID=569 RepID=UPI0028BF536A|nr:hypothetical protein [Hafnia alvei]WNN54802.1 hypothetical protein RIN66_22090 [Hafnia alvei]